MLPLSGDLRAAVGVRHVWVEASPAALETYLSMRDPRHGDPRRDWTRDLRIRESLETEMQADFGGEIGQELKACATGPRKVDAAIRIDALSFEGSAYAPDHRDQLVATVEFFPVEGGASLARFSMSADSPRAPGMAGRVDRVAVAVNDPVDRLAEHAGRALCMQAFGRNPRPPAFMNMTR